MFYRTVAGSAIDGVDYEGVTDSITFTGSVGISVYVLPDIVRDPGKTFSLEITSVFGATINPNASAAEVTINDLPVEYVATLDNVAAKRMPTS